MHLWRPSTISRQAKGSKHTLGRQSVKRLFTHPEIVPGSTPKKEKDKERKRNELHLLSLRWHPDHSWLICRSVVRVAMDTSRSSMTSGEISQMRNWRESERDGRWSQYRREDNGRKGEQTLETTGRRKTRPELPGAFDVRRRQKDRQGTRAAADGRSSIDVVWGDVKGAVEQAFHAFSLLSRHLRVLASFLSGRTTRLSLVSAVCLLLCHPYWQIAPHSYIQRLHSIFILLPWPSTLMPCPPKRWHWLDSIIVSFLPSSSKSWYRFLDIFFLTEILFSLPSLSTCYVNDLFPYES